MDHKAFADALRHGLNDAKARGVATVSVDDVLKHVSALEDAVSNQSPNSSNAVEEANRRSWEKYLEDYRAYLSARNETEIKMFESVISAGQNATRILLAINGGAAIAVLAFLGHLASIDSSMIKAFASPLRWFTFGVALMGLVAGGTYLSQLAFSSEKRVLQWCGSALQFAVVSGGLASIYLFIVGVNEMSTLFSNFVLPSD